MKTIIVVPIYKENAERSEIFSLLRLRQLNTENVTLIHPISLDISQYKNLYPGIGSISFDDNNFSSIETYNKLMLSTHFYEKFSCYDYILIHQLDAFLFHANINFFTNLNYDYIGAPWRYGCKEYPYIFNRWKLKIFKKNVYVGNGGLSLRKVDSVLNLLYKRKNHITLRVLSEDVFFGYWGTFSDEFLVPTPNIAATFSVETEPEYWIKSHIHLPMGIHGYDVWATNYYHSLLFPYFENIKLQYSEFNL
jgi:hypothetical protein